MNLKMSFLATLSVALFAFSANAEIIHQSDFEAEPTTGFGVGVETMGFNDCGGDLIGFSGNGNPLQTGDSMGVVTTNSNNSGSFAYAVDVGITTDTGGDPAGSSNGWGAAWCGQDTEGGSGGFTDQATAIANGDGCYVDFAVGSTFTVTCQIATDPAAPLTGTATGEVRLEFGDVTAGLTDVIPRKISTRLGVADLDSAGAFQEVTISYTLTQADFDLAVAAGQDQDPPVSATINSVSAVMGIEAAGFGTSTGLILFDDFVFEVDDASVVVVGNGHETTALKGDVDLDGSVTFLDIQPFITVLSGGGFQAEADCDCSGDVTFLDIQPFIDILAGN